MTDFTKAAFAKNNINQLVVVKLSRYNLLILIYHVSLLSILIQKD